MGSVWNFITDFTAVWGTIGGVLATYFGLRGSVKVFNRWVSNKHEKEMEAVRREQKWQDLLNHRLSNLEEFNSRLEKRIEKNAEELERLTLNQIDISNDISYIKAKLNLPANPKSSN